MPKKVKQEKILEQPTEAIQQHVDNAEGVDKFWRDVRESNRLLLTGTLENVDRIIGLVVSSLRNHMEATEYLAEAEVILFDLEEFTRRYRFTLPRSHSEYLDRLFRLTHLADINAMKLAGTWPIAPDGKGATLSPMQQQALWY